MPLLISIIAAGLILMLSPWNEPLVGSKLGGLIIAASGFLMGLANVSQTEKIFARLQNAETSICTRIIELFRKDAHLGLCQLLIYAASLFSFAFGTYLVFSGQALPIWGLAVWIILIGLGFEGWSLYQKRFTHYLDPYEVQKLYQTAAKNSIREHKEIELCNWLDALAEIGVKACDRSSAALAVSIVNGFPSLIKHFLDSCKTVFFQNKDSESQKFGIQDKVSYTLFFLFQRLELIQDRALSNRLESVITALITSLGKIALYGAEYDLSLAAYPLHFLGRFSLQAQKQGMKEVGVKATLTLVEVARLLLTEIDLTYGDLKEPFFSLIKNLEQIAKETYRLDKTTEISLLTAPFKQIRTFFNQEKIKDLRDTPAILTDIDRVLGEFEALEVILKSLPPIPVIAEEKPVAVTSTPDLNLPGMPTEGGFSPPPIHP